MTAGPELDARRRRCEEFQDRWLAFVQRWRRVDRDDPARARRLVAKVLSEGLPETDKKPRPDRSAQLRCAMAVVGGSALWDEEGYAEANRLATRRTDRSCTSSTRGGATCAHPASDFDLWWYTCTYLDPTAEDVNPLLHYLLEGRHAGHEPVPGPAPARSPTRYAEGHTAASRLPVRGLRPRRHHRRLRRPLPARAGPPRRGVLPRRRRARAGRARQARRDRRRGLERPARGLRLRLLVAAGPRPRGVGPAGRLRRGDPRQRQLLPRAPPRRGASAEMDARACDWWSLQATSMEFNEDKVGVDASMPLDQARARDDRPAAVVRRAVPPPQLLLPGAAPAGPRRPGLPVPARHGVRPAHQAARGRQVRDRHRPLPDGLRLPLRDLGRRALPVPPAVLAPHLRPRRGRLPAGQAQLPRREPP